MEGEPMTRALLPRERREVAAGAVHMPDWLTPEEQRDLVAACRDWARSPAPMHATVLPTGATMSAQTVCLGWHWLPYRYSRIAEDVDGSPVKAMPASLVELGRRAVADAFDPEAATGYEPDAALVNFYDETAKMGMHRDREEVSDAPVVSLSIGDDCVFRFGNTEHRNRPYTDVTLCSGDLFVFGGPSRFAFHGVPRIIPGTGDPATGLASGRLNITMRVTGLPDD
jgi:alkylated DNA repair protein (DNA oxidative demethylase)